MRGVDDQNEPERPLLDMTTSPAGPKTPRALSSQRSGWLQVVHAPGEGLTHRVVPLERDQVLALGRGSDNGPGLLADARASRIHARIAFDARENRFRVGDARSRNGTFLNGLRVESALLEPGSLLRVGDTILVYAEERATAHLKEQAARVAAHDGSVLILGETGTGKEVLARHLHEQSGRKGPFVAVNCAALPRELIASELFGYERGAFSGAQKPRLGLFRSADQGTLLLDEIGDMPLDLMASLLRVLQEKRVRPVGSDTELSVDVRVLSATHVDLAERVKAATFRGDLFARLAQDTLRIRPLRERREDIFTLAGEFAARAGRQLRMTADAAEVLGSFDFPFNVRELAALVAAHVRGCLAEQPLDVDFLYETKPEMFEDASSAEAKAGAEPESLDRARLLAAVQRSAGNLAAAAKQLGISRPRLYRLIKAEGLSVDELRAQDAD